MNLQGASAIVTGGAQNLGRAIAISLAEQGCRVVVLDKDETHLAQLPKLENLWGRVCDVTDPTAASAAIDDVIARQQKIDILVNCAGWIFSAPLYSPLIRPDGKHPLELWNKTIATNLTSTFVMGSHVVEHMIKKRIKGLIVNISSISAHGNTGQSAYSAAKAGVNALTVTWAKELGPWGIRTVAIAPGFIDTPSTQIAMAPERLQEWIDKTPLRRLGTPEQIANTVIFVAENDYLNGAILDVDGGLSI